MCFGYLHSSLNICVHLWIFALISEYIRNISQSSRHVTFVDFVYILTWPLTSCQIAGNFQKLFIKLKNLRTSLHICFVDICTHLWVFVFTSGYLHPGPTGAGKSTVAAHLRDQHQVALSSPQLELHLKSLCYSKVSWNTYILYFQWAFYEGDCYLYGLDPFSGPLKKWAKNCEKLELLNREISLWIHIAHHFIL